MGSCLRQIPNNRRYSLLQRHTRRESAPPKTSFSITVPDSFPQPTTTTTAAASIKRRDPIPETDLSWPFGQIEGLDRDEIREAAYEIFFSSCRYSSGSSSRQAAQHDGGDGGGGSSSSPGSLLRGNGVGMVATSKIKRALGLKHQLMRMSSRRSSTGMVEFSNGGSPRRGSYAAVPAKTMARRPLTSAEIMRMQMKVTEQSDSRLRKTLTRALAGQSRNNNKPMARRPETIILPLELLRHLKPSDFTSAQEYHSWQRRQLHFLSAALITHPSTPLDSRKHRSSITHLKDIAHSSSHTPIDTSTQSKTMQSLCNSVISLAWRNTTDGDDICHWIDGYPLNINIYVTLLQAVFDPREETMVLDQVDELLELVKKTWALLGITRVIHNVCFAWVLFNQYVVTGEVEQRLVCAAARMMDEVEKEAKKVVNNRDDGYVKVLASVLISMIDWGEKRLMDYHQGFEEGNALAMENLVKLVLMARKIMDEDVAEVDPNTNTSFVGSSRVNLYIQSSMKNAFTKVLGDGLVKEKKEALNKLAQEVEELAAKELETYTNILRKWNPMAAGIAAMTLHNCYGEILRQYLSSETMFTYDTINILQRAEKLENILLQMAADDDAERGGEGESSSDVVKKIIPYEVDSIILGLINKWVDHGLVKSRECVKRAKEIETWNPKCKAEPFAQSVVQLINLAKEILNDFFQLPVGIKTNDVIHDLSNGLESVFIDYINFVASCGTKQSYLPTFPPLTRCNQDSKLSKFLKKASCGVGVDQLLPTYYLTNNHHCTHPSTSRGTQRLYIRLNTLHYLLTHLNSLENTLSMANKDTSHSHFNLTKEALQSAIHHVAEVAAYRLILLDSHTPFCESLYAFGVTNNSRIAPTVLLMRHNLTLLTDVLIDKAQPLVVKEVMKVAYNAFLTVLLAGGSNRVFNRHDHDLIQQDFESLKKIFCTAGIGLIAEDEVDKEAKVAEDVIGLMGWSTEDLIEEFCGVVCGRCEAVLSGGEGGVRKLPMPSTTGKWHKEDPNTILRVLCHRDDQVANCFLKKTFQLPKRR